MARNRNGRVTRREFLKWQAAGAAWLAAGASGLLAPSSVLADAAPDLAAATGSPAAATRAAVELLGGMKAFVKPGQKVLIKPNMSFAQGVDSATTTHPEVVRALAVMCREAGAGKVSIVDNPLSSVELCLEQSGIQAACAVVPGSEVKGIKAGGLFRETPLPRGVSMKVTDVMTEVLEADVLIAAPVAKHHGSAGVSLSMKGMMGLIHDRGVMHSRHDLHTAIVDLCTRLKADLAVIDATRVLTTNGPGGPGKVDRPDTVIAGRDMVAADALAVSMFRWYDRQVEPRQVKHIRIAHERGFGRMDIENLRVARVAV
ncbi:MAG: DUF362 domain-containing protein [Thermodesulfobacteriota bacterium]